MLTRVKVTVWWRLVIFPHMGRPATLHNLAVTFPPLENKPTRTVSYKMFDLSWKVLSVERGVSSVLILVSRCPSCRDWLGWSNVTSFSPPQLPARHFTQEPHQLHKHLVGSAGAPLHSTLATASLPGQYSRFYIPADRTMQGL